MEFQDTDSNIIWLDQTSHYHQLLSFDQQNESNIIGSEKVSMGYHVPDEIILWKECTELSKNNHHLYINDNNVLREISTTLNSPIFNYDHTNSCDLKRSLNENHLAIGELDNKYFRLDESIKNNLLIQGWSSDLDEEFTQDLSTDIDGFLSSFAVTNVGNTVASYNMSDKHEVINNGTIKKSTLTAVNDKRINNAETNFIHINNHDNKVQSASVTNLEVSHSNLNDIIIKSSTSSNHVSSSQEENKFNDTNRFQCILSAATSIATKINEETLTYLNQGQSYEIKLKKLNNLSEYCGKILTSTIRICFHERRLQYTEREQILAWQRARPGERLLEVDIPLSYGILDIVQSSSKNSVEFMWDPTKEVGVYIKVNCISTEFTPKKHGGEKGVPFKIHVETMLPGGPCLHAASCQIKVFKLKGADRKHKQERDKILRLQSYKPKKHHLGHDYTVLYDIPLDISFTYMPQSEADSPTSSNAISSKLLSSSSDDTSSSLYEANKSVTSFNGKNSTIMEPTSSSKSFKIIDNNPPPKNKNVEDAAAWLRKYFPNHESTFANYSGIDLLNLTRQEFIQICGPLDGIRMYNEITKKAPSPKLVIYCAVESDIEPIWKIVCLYEKTTEALTSKLSSVFNLSKDCLHSIWLQGPRGIRVLMCNDLISNMDKESVYLVQLLNDSPIGYFKVLLKPYDG